MKAQKWRSREDPLRSISVFTGFSLGFHRTLHDNPRQLLHNRIGSHFLSTGDDAMRVTWAVVGLVLICLSKTSCGVEPQAPLPAGQLVREVVYNELNDHQKHGYWSYWIERRSQQGTRRVEQLETPEGPVDRLTLENGRPLCVAQQNEEASRLERLLHSPEEQQKRRQEYAEDENRIGRILALLPDAFVYEYAGAENGSYRLKFHPNPDYPARSIEARIFHAMSGELWVDARSKRLARLEGHVEENVDFGYGILGRLYKGGWFRLVRTQVSATDWKTAQLEVHMNGRALLVKSFAKETSETRGGFVQAPEGMNLEQGIIYLKSSENRALLATPATLVWHP
jgi:hypothetical protein